MLRLLFYSIAIALLVHANGALADKSKTEQELKQLRAAINSVQRELSKNQQAQSSAERRLADSDRALAQATKALRDTRQSIASRQQELQSLQQEQTQKKTDSQKQKLLLANQLRSAYASGNQEYIKLLLNQEDPTKVTRILKYYDYLNKARVETIQSLQQNLKRLTAISDEINANLLTLEELKTAQEQQRQQQVASKQQQQNALAALKQEYSSNNQRLSKLKRNEQELQKLLNQLEQTLKNFSPPQSLEGLAAFKQKLNWPVQGSVLHRFGTSKLDSSLRWNGIIIAGKEGREVQSVQQGRVVFADWLRGFGLMTIIDHGKGYLSLYGHNQSLLKNAGDFVEAGEPIATIGQSGGFAQSGLYFEIRYKGKPQNPLRWIKQ